VKIIQLKECEKIQEGLRSLTEEFIKEYPYYSTWVQKNNATFKDRTRVVYELNDNESTVGYMMIHFSTNKCAKINGIYVFPEYQKRGYVRDALLQVLKELKELNYDYAYIQTRIHNKIVVHMFETLHFDVIGKNYHNIEQQSNWVAVYDLKQNRNFDEMFDLAEQLYSGFSKI
jgi:ribosomal protein S18 acetylase RimI-like enzyme